MSSGPAWTPQDVEEYLAKWKVEEAVQAAVNPAIRSRTSDPIMHIADFLEAKGKAAEEQANGETGRR